MASDTAVFPKWKSPLYRAARGLEEGDMEFGAQSSTLNVPLSREDGAGGAESAGASSLSLAAPWFRPTAKRPLLCEMHYPLMHDRSFFFAQLSAEGSEQLAEMSPEQRMKYMTTTFGMAVAENLEEITIDTKRHVCKLIYRHHAAAKKAKRLAVDESNALIFLTSEYVSTNKVFSLFIDSCRLPGIEAFQVTEEDMQAFLKSCGCRPSEVKKFILPLQDARHLPCFFCLKPTGSDPRNCYACRLCEWQWRTAQQVRRGIAIWAPFMSPSPSNSSHQAHHSIRAGGHVHHTHGRNDSKLKSQSEICWKLKYPNEESLRNVQNIVQARLGQQTHVNYEPPALTQGLVICFRTSEVPAELFQKLQLTTPHDNFHSIQKRKGRLVEEFEYAKVPAFLNEKDFDDGFDDEVAKRNIVLPHEQCKGDVYYSRDVWEAEQNNYARLVTENWWYVSLALSFLTTALALMDLYSNVIYAAHCFAPDAPGLPVDYRSNVGYRYNFVFCFLILESLHFRRCWAFSREDIHTEFASGAGNIVPPKTRWDWFSLHFSTFVFVFVTLPKLMKEIVTTLHPYTNVQQKAAAKMDGARVFVISYDSEHMYRVTAGMGLNKQFPPLIFSRAALTVFKVHWAVTHRIWMSVFLCATGLVLLPYQVWKFKQLMACRRLLFRDTMKGLELWVGSEAAKLTRKDLEKYVEAKKMVMKPQHKALIKTRWKHFPEQKDSTFNIASDSFTKALVVCVVSFLVINLSIHGLEHCGVLHTGMVEAASIRQLPHVSLSTILAADVDGDGMLSVGDLATLGIIPSEGGPR